MSFGINFLTLNKLVREAAENPDCLRDNLTAAIDLLEAAATAPTRTADDQVLIAQMQKLLRLGLEEPKAIDAAVYGVYFWTCYMATEYTLVGDGNRAGAQNTGSKGGKRRKGIADNRRADWVEAAEGMRERNKHRTAADMARTIASEPDETAKPDTIARHLKKQGF